ncbi:MAG: sugar ABC transporter permease [Xanthobacteraceae bacterium]|nr:sugar ABC transporter permease [Xanthobacteraceae bacterium]MCW5678160.1 sugar ABC transporter permease [Xanthobacteraceae bacterium]
MSNPAASTEQSRMALYGWMLLAPALILLITFAFIPAFETIWESIYSKGTLRRPSHFVGVENYLSLFSDPAFRKVVTNNLIYAGITIPVSIAIALGMALWANAQIIGRGFVRAAYFTPTMLPMIAAANLWLFFYTPDLGVIDRITALFGFPSVNWLGQQETALYSVIAVTIWKEAGFYMIFYLAALQTISPELREAATVEGAGRWTYTRRVVLPLLAPTTMFVLVNALINSVKLIDHLFILTKGGPDNASKLILYWVWEMAFAYFDTPQAATMTTLILVVLGIVAAVQFAVLERRVHYR